MNMREYLAREARRITDRSLKEYSSPEAWRTLVPERRRQFLEMMGLAGVLDNRPTVPATITGVVQRPGYRIEKLYYESLPDLYVTANLYVPEGPPGSEIPTSSLPAVLYTCGHSDTQKVEYQGHARRLVQLGFVCLIVETIQLGEVRGHHHGCYREGWFHWYSRGYTPAGVELLNGVRGLDYLCQRPDVNPEKLGVTGTSGGGAATWWIAAADERVKAAAPSCGTATLASHIADRTIDGHCDCMWWINSERWDLADVGALIAPRPLLIASADRDSIFTIASIREIHRQLQQLYTMLGAAENLDLVEVHGPHSYQPGSRTAIFSWFVRHLQGKDSSPEEVGDMDAPQNQPESEEALRVFADGPLKEDRSLTIQDELIPHPPLPVINNPADVPQARDRLCGILREKTFGAFPADGPLDLKVDFEFDTGNGVGCRFGFTPEHGGEWRLHGELIIPRSAAPDAPVLVVLRGPRGDRRDAEVLAGRVGGPRVVVEPRGTGETAWGEELQWHLRRASAWTGRTLASMRVYDTLRALEAVRALPGASGRPVALAAQGEMGAVALYAALIDGQLQAILLEDPPATQDAPSYPGGGGPTIEMLNCLRYTDLPQVAGLLYPMPIMLVSSPADTYSWAEDLYRKLGSADRFHRIARSGPIDRTVLFPR